MESINHGSVNFGDISYGGLFDAIPNEDAPDPDTIHRGTPEELTHIIASLSRLFFSTYFINLAHDTFRAVTQLRRVGELLGNEVNFTAGLQIYANHFIHPDDRREYLRVMNVDNLRQELRWWNPCMAVEYRRPVENPGGGGSGWGWVRATAVLSQAGENDLPLTAVYVAQDISGGRRQI